MLNLRNLAIIFVLLFSVGAILNCSPLLADSSKISTHGSIKKDLIRRILKKNALTKLPYASNVVVSSRKSTSSAVKASAISGTPPTLASIPGTSIKELFWRDGVVDSIGDGHPSQMQCGEFFAGQDDGLSGGMGACHMAEGIGFTFADLVQSQTSLCYMKNFPTKKNLAAGAISVVSGQFPNGDINKIFNSPSGGSRLIKVNVSAPPNQGEGEGPGDQTIFLRVSSTQENRTNSNLYEVVIWHCEDDQSVQEVNHFSISSNGKFSSENLGVSRSGSGSFQCAVSGLIKISGSSLKWDATKSRDIEKSFSSEENSFKAKIQIASTIKSKTLDSFDGKLRKDYSVSSFSGSDVSDVRFTAGAYKGIDVERDVTFTGAAEYRDSYYAAAPSSSLLKQVKDFDFSSDDFYNSTAEVNNDFSSYSCAALPDLELNLDMGNSAMEAVRSKCEMQDFRNMHFCHDSPEVQSAEQNYGEACRPPGDNPPPPPP